MHTRCIRVMAHSRALRTASRRRRGRPARLASVWRLTRSGRRAFMALLAAPLAIRILVGAVAVLAVWSAVNWLYQVVRKPTELFFPVSGALAKAPPETWRQYGPLFRRHSTVVITPELLAALAQVEGAGHPAARTYWRRRRAVGPVGGEQPPAGAGGRYNNTRGTLPGARALRGPGHPCGG